MNPYDVGAALDADHAVDATSVTAGGSGDATEVDGSSIDTQGLDSESVDLIVHGSATLDEDETLTIAGNWQDSADDQSFADVGDALAATVVATGPTGGGTVEFTLKLGSLNLALARRYVRAQVTPDLSRANTDTASIMGVYVRDRRIQS